jgi:alpha-galactosidase
MIKVALIGAGSVVFSRNLTGDILSHPEFRSATLAYHDIDPDRLDVATSLARKVAGALGANPTIQATLDRRAALDGADFVINMVQIGGFDSTLVDFEIPRKYGLNFTIADTTGPGGLFRALRTYPFLTALCRDMEEVCPRAVLLNYSNPMSMNMQAIARTSCVRAVGLCHSVQGTFDQLMHYLGEDPRKVAFVCAGINHMAFYLRLEKDGVDLYPRLFEAMCRPDVYNANKVRFELMKRLGYFVTESSEHNAEYNPFFLAHGRDHAARFDVPVDEYLRRCDAIVDEFDRLKALARSGESIEVHRSHEYGSTIIHSIATGAPSVVYGNAPNRGSISNLPDNAIVEVATVCDRTGLRPTTVGELPPQLVAYVQPHVAEHELFIRAAIEGRRDHVYQAAMFDPLTAATLPPDRIVELCDELIAAHGFERDGGVLPPLDTTPTRVPTCGKTFPRVDPRALRASWDAAQSRAAEEFLDSWHVIGPFPSPTPGEVSLDQPTPVEDDYLRRGDGTINLKLAYDAGNAVLTWERCFANPKTGMVNLTAEVGPFEWCIAYGYTEFESPTARDTVLRLGSDDGVRAWLNGEMIHTNEARRAYSLPGDPVPVKLRAGRNQLLVKIDNARFNWAFGAAVPKTPA